MNATAGATVGRSFWASFSRSQASSFAATIVDFGLLTLLFQVFGVWYVVATAIGAFCGAVTNFILNRSWTFNTAHHAWHGQAARYALVSAGSLGLNTWGTWLVTENTHLYPVASAVLVSIFVGFLFNFPLQRYFVFKH